MTQQTIKISEAKGRPMLQWVGKHPLSAINAYPARLVEKFDPTGEIQPAPDARPKNLLLHGDNKDALAWLLANGYRRRINLVYIDPPFDSGADYVRKVQLRGMNTSTMDGAGYSLGEQTQYTDIWTNDTYLQFMYERLLLLKELLIENGSIYLHCDFRKSHMLKLICDEIFGSENFRNEIIWKRQSAHNDASQYGAIHDTIFYYTKSAERTWNSILIDPSPDYIDQFFDQVEPETNRRYARGDLTAGGLSGSGYEYEFGGVIRVWRAPKSTMERYGQEGRIHWPKKGVPRLKRYLDEFEGVPVQDMWTDIRVIHNQSTEREDYPTQKPESLLERIIRASTNPGDLVLDCFIGSGTTAAVAQKHGRQWIAADLNHGAVQTTAKRLRTLMATQIEGNSAQAVLPGLESPDASPSPAALSFGVYRVNDYDLNIQHNEAVEIAVERVGIQRIYTDTFFDGLLGEKLVKIISFQHPLTLLDLQTLQDELAARPTEARDVVLVCLGKETVVDAWLDTYNKHRPVNRITVIELRTDPKHGGLLLHQPAQAKVNITRQKAKIFITIEEFISPTITQRLQRDATLFANVTIPDWRAMVDYVLIDTAFDGEVFNVILVDLPERKSDLVQGYYELPAPEGDSTVAVKIVDMLGEEVLILNHEV